MEKLCPHWSSAFSFRIFINLMNILWHLSARRLPYKFEFLFIEWRVSCPYTWKTWRFTSTTMELWGIGDLYLSEVRGGGMMIGLRERRSCQLLVGAWKFFLAFLVVEEHAHYMNMCTVEIFTRTKWSHLVGIYILHRICPLCHENKAVQPLRSIKIQTVSKNDPTKKWPQRWQ